MCMQQILVEIVYRVNILFIQILLDSCMRPPLTSNVSDVMDYNPRFPMGLEV